MFVLRANKNKENDRKYPQQGVVDQANETEPANNHLEKTLPLPSEQDLVADILAGDRKAIAQFVARYSDVVYDFLCRRLSQPELADDLLQEVFLAAWVRLREFRGESALATWLCGIARHKVADYYRERLAKPWLEGISADEELLLELPGSQIDLDEHIERLNIEARTRQIMAVMPDDYRVVLLWRYWDCRSAAEMASISNKTTKAVERLLARARHDFAQRWNNAQKMPRQ